MPVTSTVLAKLWAHTTFWLRTLSFTSLYSCEESCEGMLISWSVYMQSWLMLPWFMLACVLIYFFSRSFHHSCNTVVEPDNASAPWAYLPGGIHNEEIVQVYNFPWVIQSNPKCICAAHVHKSCLSGFRMTNSLSKSLFFLLFFLCVACAGKWAYTKCMHHVQYLHAYFKLSKRIISLMLLPKHLHHSKLIFDRIRLLLANMVG